MKLAALASLLSQVCCDWLFLHERGLNRRWVWLLCSQQELCLIVNHNKDIHSYWHLMSQSFNFIWLFETLSNFNMNIHHCNKMCGSYSYGLKFTYTHYGHECYGNLGYLIFFNSFFPFPGAHKFESRVKSTYIHIHLHWYLFKRS